jgi:hypothetical protein
MSEDLFVGLRGFLTLTPWARDAWSDEPHDEDACGPLTDRSAMLGLADFHGRPQGGEQWGPAGCGGDWRGDGAEHLLAWMQMLITSAAQPQGGHRRKGLVPIGSSFGVIEDVLERIGTASITQLDAIVPLDLMADPVARVVSGRNWVALGSEAAERIPVVIEIDAERSRNTARHEPDIVECMSAVGGEVLGPIRSGLGEETREDDARRFLNRSFSRNSVRLSCVIPGWTTDSGAWLIEFAAYACLSAKLGGSALIAVRRGDL